jgi:hypothetical protein
MNDKKKSVALIGLIVVAALILIVIGSTFAYFSISLTSEENAISLRAAEFSIELDDDTSLIKSQLIPSIEEYVDRASARVDGSGNFLKPYEDQQTGELVKAGTTCIDDNTNEICSIYTFTIINRMTDYDLPLYITLNPSVNTFANLYFKVLDENLDEVISATHLVDDRPYTLDANDNPVYEANSTISPIVLTNINTTLAKATNDQTPSTVTYHIVIWIMENNENQTETDSGKLFAATLKAQASGANGRGITGVISASGTDGG